MFVLWSLNTKAVEEMNPKSQNVKFRYTKACQTKRFHDLIIFQYF